MQFEDRGEYQEEEEQAGLVIPEDEGLQPVDAPEEPEAAEIEWDETLVPYGMSTDELSWTNWYASCPQFAQPWAMTQEGAEWPKVIPWIPRAMWWPKGVSS